MDRKAPGRARTSRHILQNSDPESSHDKEATLLGYTTRNKTLIFLGYAWIWRAPEAFSAWCGHSVVSRFGGPVDLLEFLFIGFKVLQLAVFLGWCYPFGDGRLSGYSTLRFAACAVYIVPVTPFASTSETPP